MSLNQQYLLCVILKEIFAPCHALLDPGDLLESYPDHVPAFVEIYISLEDMWRGPGLRTDSLNPSPNVLSMRSIESNITWARKGLKSPPDWSILRVTENHALTSVGDPI